MHCTTDDVTNRDSDECDRSKEDTLNGSEYRSGTCDIEQVYQMADAYLFPVVEQGRCIDVPLSCMEAAACNKPVVTTDFGEMREFVGKDGFYFINSFEADELKAKIEQALGADGAPTRSAVLDYDWRFATEFLAGGKRS